MMRIFVSIFSLLLFISTNIFADGVQVVPITNKVIKYKAQIRYSDIRLVEVSDKYKCKEYLDVNILRQNKYHATHYIHKNKIVCKKNVYVPVSSKIKFKFGNLEIERDGTVIKETDQYIRIKNLDGTIDKIYKNGRN